MEGRLRIIPPQQNTAPPISARSEQAKAADVELTVTAPNPFAPQAQGQVLAQRSAPCKEDGK